MIYIELQLGGNVHVYDLPDELVLMRVTIEARAEHLPVPRTVEEAHEYLRANCYQLEMFETLPHAFDWAEAYRGFRAGEVRAGLARFEIRRRGRRAPGVHAA